MSEPPRPIAWSMAILALLLPALGCDTGGAGKRSVFDESAAMRPDAQSLPPADKPTGAAALLGVWGARQGNGGENAFFTGATYSVSNYRIEGRAIHTELSLAGDYTTAADQLTFTIDRSSCPAQRAGKVQYRWEIADHSLTLIARDGTRTVYTKGDIANPEAYDQDIGCFDDQGTFTRGTIRSVSP